MFTSHDFYADLVNYQSPCGNDIDIDNYTTQEFGIIHILTVTGTYNNHEVNIRIKHADKVGALGGFCSIVTDDGVHVHRLDPKCDSVRAEYSVCTPTDVVSEITAFLFAEAEE